MPAAVDAESAVELTDGGPDVTARVHDVPGPRPRVGTALPSGTAVPPYHPTMGERLTPRELAEELGVSDRAVRQWLRDQSWQAVPYARWHLTAEQASQVRAHFRP